MSLLQKMQQNFDYLPGLGFHLQLAQRNLREFTFEWKQASMFYVRALL